MAEEKKECVPLVVADRHEFELAVRRALARTVCGVDGGVFTNVLIEELAAL